MQREVEIKVFPEEVQDGELHRRKAAKRLKLSPKRIRELELMRRSVDARGRQPKFVLRYRAWIDQEMEPEPPFEMKLQDVSGKPEVLIVGFGPAGMFAALKLIELGIKPVVLERGKEVRGRRRDLAALNKQGLVNPESNYCFGEGGAGTFSDGKLYTRSHKRGNVRRILDIFVAHGANPEILVETHPHIGTNKLPKIVENMRETIRECGGEVRFDTKVTDFVLESGRMTGVKTADGATILAEGLILATGHSARDIFRLLHARQVLIEAKPFALGVRVEHPQALIDQVRWHCSPRPETLPAASYNMVTQVQERGVYSFCMCPGGIICPAATENDEVVVNGWSPSKRDSPFANSGIVVEISPEELSQYSDEGVFAGVAFQQAAEQAAYRAGGGAQKAPAMRLTDFVAGKASASLPDCSYLPGIIPADLNEVLPESVYDRLRKGFQDFGQKMRGYLTQDAVVVGVESRTSSPVRIPRERDTLMHPEVAGLFPCGEGAGYAGGIMSAALDGERCAVAAATRIQK